MLLNALEKAAMNNPIRAACQRWIEGPALRSIGGPLSGGTALEVGCGRGVGVEIILDRFGAGRVEAFDLDPDMVERARRRLAARGDRVRLWTGDAAAIEASDAAYDAVFDFGIIHHVPEWRTALGEVRRVLKPGGTFYLEEIYALPLGWGVTRRLLRHPEADRFDHASLGRALADLGFEVAASRNLLALGGMWAVRAPTA